MRATSSPTPRNATPPRTEPLIVADLADHDPCVADAGALLLVPLRTADDQRVGTVCALAPVVRGWCAREMEILRELAGWAVGEIELREQIRERHRLASERVRLLARERSARARAEFAGSRAVFLAEASALLDASLDYPQTARAARPPRGPDARRLLPDR